MIYPINLINPINLIIPISSIYTIIRFNRLAKILLVEFDYRYYQFNQIFGYQLRALGPIPHQVRRTRFVAAKNMILGLFLGQNIQFDPF